MAVQPEELGSGQKRRTCRLGEGKSKNVPGVDAQGEFRRLLARTWAMVWRDLSFKLVSYGDPLPTRTDQTRGAHAEEPRGWTAQLFRAPHHQRRDGRIEQPNSRNQKRGSWLS